MKISLMVEFSICYLVGWVLLTVLSVPVIHPVLAVMVLLSLIVRRRLED